MKRFECLKMEKHIKDPWKDMKIHSWPFEKYLCLHTITNTNNINDGKWTWLPYYYFHLDVIFSQFLFVSTIMLNAQCWCCAAWFPVIWKHISILNIVKCVRIDIFISYKFLLVVLNIDILRELGNLIWCAYEPTKI